MNTETAENKLGTLPVRQLLLKMSVPLVLSLLIQVLYGLVDSLYVAQISNKALTAISLCTPVQYLITGIGAGIGVGTNALLSKQLGAGDRENISRIIGNGFNLTDKRQGMMIDILSFPWCSFRPLWTLRSPFPGRNGYFPCGFLTRAKIGENTYHFTI